MFNVVAED